MNVSECRFWGVRFRVSGFMITGQGARFERQTSKPRDAGRLISER